MGRGVEVSKGRYIDISGDPPTHEQALQEKIRKLLEKARFKRATLRSSIRITQAILNCEEHRAAPYNSYKGKKVTRISFGGVRKEGRNDEELLRFQFISAIWSSWNEGTEIKPTINNKGDEQTPFVQFAVPFFKLAHIGKVLTHLEDYESYRQALLKKNQTYEEWKAERLQVKAFRKNLQIKE